MYPPVPQCTNTLRKRTDFLFNYSKIRNVNKAPFLLEPFTVTIINNMMWGVDNMIWGVDNITTVYTVGG